VVLQLAVSGTYGLSTPYHIITYVVDDLDHTTNTGILRYEATRKWDTDNENWIDPESSIRGSGTG
jgi:hypothetical protein